MPIVIFSNLREKDKTEAVERLIAGSTPSQDFFLMIILSVLTATFGLLQQNIAVIIGSMLIAPMLYPILSMALGITITDFRLISRSFYTLLKSMTFAIIFSALATFLFSSQHAVTVSDLIKINDSTLSSVAVAVVAGLAAAFALVKPHLNETLPGTAISVTLIPPLASIGIGVAKFSPELVSSALLLFIINAACIVFVSTIVFSLMDFHAKRAEARKDVKKEDTKLEREIKAAK